jgi:hypothetical protein
MHAGSICAIWSGAANGLSLGFGLVHPLSCYRVYDIENSQLVSPGGLLEVSVQLLDEDRFGLRRGGCQ